jgi:hypothetical protein
VKPIVLIIILVVLVVLFIIGMALGARGGGPPDLNSLRSTVEQFFGSLVAGTALASGDVTQTTPNNATGCTNLLAENGQATINTGGFCQFSVRAEKNAVRSLSLQLNQGNSGRFTTEAHTPEVNLDITLNQCKQVQLMEDGGTLRVTCTGVQPCVFRATQCP